MRCLIILQFRVLRFGWWMSEYIYTCRLIDGTFKIALIDIHEQV